MISQADRNVEVAQIRDLTKSFGQVQVIDGLSFDLNQGELVAIIGPSGGGKTTLLRLLSGLESPDCGSISIFGQTPLIARNRRVFSQVFQTPALLPWATVLENIKLPTKIAGAQGHLWTAQETLKLVDLIGFDNAYPHELSGGMRQRVALARALIVAPQILLLDEPFSSIDERSREDLQDTLLGVRQSLPHLTTVLVTHSIQEAVYLADRVIILSHRPAKIVNIVDIKYSESRGIQLRDSQEISSYARRVRACLN